MPEWLALVLTTPGDRAQALAIVARSLAEAGHAEEASSLAAQLEQAMPGVEDARKRPQALASAASALAAATLTRRAFLPGSPANGRGVEMWPLRRRDSPRQ